MTKLLATGRYVDKLYHISDIHIRLYQRLDEYQHVFNEFYSFLDRRLSENALIVITGDLLHHKNELSPECIVFTSKFLRDLASRFPVILIAGNHDALLNNTHRMDSISALLPDCANLFYLKDSGFYKYGNIVFGVSSLLDSKIVRMPTEKEDGCCYVALYHGGVGQFRTNKGFEMEGMPISTFDGYDMVLLGDIHLHQYMDKKKRIAYAGSMISQNFSETDADHGVLVWNIPDSSSHLIRLDNPFAYTEVILTPPVISFRTNNYNVSDDIPLPPKGRVAVLHDEKTSEHVECMKTLRSRLPKIQFMEKLRVRFTTPSPSTQPNIVKDMESVLSLPTILRQFLSRLSPSDHDPEITSVILSKSPTNTNTTTHTGIWELLSLEFSHMFGYGENNRIDFTKLPPHETIGVFGDNSVGKSSLLEILSFLFYGNITRYSHGQSVPREVIHFDKKKSKGGATFRIGNTIYKIEKEMTLGKTGKIRVDEKLWVCDKNGEFVDYSEEHRKKTDKVIASLIGPYEHFMFTTFFLQQTEQSFRSMTPRERKEFLHSLLDLNRYDQLNSESSDELKGCKRDLEKTLTELKSYLDLKSIQASISQSRSQILLNKQKQQEVDDKVSAVRAEMKELVRNRRVVPEDLEARIESIKHKRTQSLSQKEKLHTLLHDQEIRHNVLYDEYKGVEITSLQDRKKVVWSELEELYKARRAVPPPPVIFHNDVVSHAPRNEDVELFSKERYDEWKAFYTGQPEPPDMNALLEKKSQLMQSIQPESKSSFQGMSSEDMQEIINTSENNKKTLENLRSKITEWENKHQATWDEWDELEQKTAQWDSHEKRLVQMFSCMKFTENCVSCKHNKTIVLDSGSEKCDLLQKKENIQPTVEQTKTQWLEWCGQRDELEQKLHDCEVIRILLHNRSVREKMASVDKKINKAKKLCTRQHLYEEADRSWNDIYTYHNARSDAEQVNGEISLHIEEKKRLMESIQKQEDVVIRFNQLQLQLQDTKKEMERVHKDLEQYEKESSEQQKWLQDLEANKEIETELGQKERVETELVAEHRTLLEDHSRLTRMFEESSRQKECREKTAVLYDQLRKRVEYLQRLVHITGRDGFPMFLLEQHLPILEKNINRIIHPFMPDKKLCLRTEKKKDTMNVQLCIEKNGTDTVYVGGMESFIIDVALKITFANMSAQPRSNVFFIDEGISALDKKNMENLDQLFQFLEQFFPHVFIISHLREAASYVRHSIHIVKEDNASQLVVKNI